MMSIPPFLLSYLENRYYKFLNFADFKLKNPYLVVTLVLIPLIIREGDIVVWLGRYKW